MSSLSLRIEAMSLDIPDVLDHPNRMPFSGVLTRVGVPSDAAPHGSNGKRVMLTTDAAQAALPSLLGMGVDLTANLDGHDAQSKIGIITGATLDGDAINISGFIYAADFPKEALRIHLKAADLGFSFEAQNLAVESMDTDPLVVKSLVFTGAAILMKNDAAYHSTSLAAAAAKEHEMNEEMKAAIVASVTAALAPVSEQIAKLQEGVSKVDALAASVEELKKAPTVIHIEANKAVMEKVEPMAAAFDSCAASLEAAGIGMHDRRGHAAVARRMASQMRSEAAMGKVPHEFSDSNSYYASADQSHQQQHQQQAPAAPKFEDSEAYKALQTQIQAGKDALASATTKITDLQAAASQHKPGPDRKTLPPFIAGIMAKTGLEMPTDDKKLDLAVIDAALDKAGTATHERIKFKLGLRQTGAIV